MDGTPFDLLALPDVAIRKTLSLMSPSQVFRMSRTSEKSKDLIMSIKFDVILRQHENRVGVWYANGKFSKIIHFGPKYEQMEEKEWRNSVSEITQLFGTSVDELNVYTKEFDDHWNWIKMEQSGVRELELTVPQTEDPHRVIEMILDNSELTQLEKLYFTMYTPSHFKFTDPFIFKNSPKALSIQNASWFTVQNLMDSKVEYCGLDGVKFTDEEINLILKQWMGNDDCLSNLKGLTIFRDNPDVDFDVAFNGFQRSNFRRVQFGYTRLRLTCGKEFYIEVLAESNTLALDKEPFVEELAHDDVAPVVDNSARFDDSDYSEESDE